MSIHLATDFGDTLGLVVASVVIVLMITAILGLSTYILLVLNKIKSYIRRRGDK